MQLSDWLRPKPLLDEKARGFERARIEALGEVLAGEERQVDGGLQGEPMVQMAQQHGKGPLVLLVAARGPHGKVARAVPRDQGWRQRRARARAGAQAAR